MVGGAEEEQKAAGDCICTEHKTLVPRSTAGTPRHSISSPDVLLGNSQRDQGFTGEDEAQMLAEAEGPQARCHGLALKQN